MKYLICIPTYNEAENIENLLKTISKLKLSNVDILVIDDNSPDGTSNIVKKLDQSKKLNNQLFVLDRKKKEGLGKAYVAAFKWALAKKYDFVFSMDADFSHDPKYLPEMIKQSKNYDVVIGSRYIPGGRVEGWEWYRYANSYGANFVTRMLLGLKPKDATAGFKCYSKKFLQSLNLDKIIAGGYAFQVEMINLAQDGDFSITEIPITFADRRAGQSKISGELKRSAMTVWQLAVRKQSYRQFVKFAVVGAINTVVDWAVYFLIMKFTGWSTQSLKQIAKALSFIVSATSSYIMNRVWTFRSKDKQVLKQAGKFFAVALVGLGLNNFIFYIITGILHWKDIFGLIIATGLVLFWNFFANKRWTFKERK